MQLSEDLFAAESNRGEFLVRFTWLMSILGLVLTVSSAISFLSRARTGPATTGAATPVARS